MSLPISSLAFSPLELGFSEPETFSEIRDRDLPRLSNSRLETETRFLVETRRDSRLLDILLMILENKKKSNFFGNILASVGYFGI
jgi:hypothetical protein